MSGPELYLRFRLFSMPEARLAGTYILYASIWVIGSDSLLSLFAGQYVNTEIVHTYKGLAFVVVTGLFLYLVLCRAFGGWRRSEEMRFAELRKSNQRFQSFSTHVQNLREEERTRISREIHDELGQLLTGIKMQLRLIENRLSDRDDRSLNPAIDELVEASSMIDETIASVQRISSGLRPPTLDHLGLAAALDEEAEHFSRRTGIECRLTLGEMKDIIPPNVETAAFRIFQESLTNVARHAKAARIDAECSTTGDMLRLVVRDDGVGIEPEVVRKPDSLGIVGMLERAADVGGKVEFDSSSGRGTSVVLTIPLPADDQPLPARCS